MQYDVVTAKNQLLTLIDAALAGEDVVIAKGSKPAVRLVAIPQTTFRFGILAGKVGTPPDFFETMPGPEMDAWDGSGGARSSRSSD